MPTNVVLEGKKTEVKEIPKKKRPGRPRKTPLRDPEPRNGISKTSKNMENHIEFSYEKAINFKKIWQYFKHMAVPKVQFIFRPNEVILWGEDHHKKSKIRIIIHGDKINHYYCASELEIGMSCRNPELIMLTIDKSYTNILLLSKHGYIQKDMRLILSNEIEIDESHKIELIGEYTKISNEQSFLDSDYTIKFELPGRYFKKMISDVRGFSSQMTIIQDGVNEPLVFEYTKSDKKITSRNIVKNKDNIKFVSKLKGDETFRVSFKVDYVRPISSALISDTVVIHAHESKPLMFFISMDNGTIELQILTEIIDERIT